MPPRRYRYDERAGRYGLAGNRGRLVSRREIRQSVDAALDRGGAAVAALTERLRDRQISLADWQLAMTREIRSATIAGLAAAHGGFDQITPAMYGRAGAHLREQYAFLRDWAAQIAAGAPIDGFAKRRAAMYVESARQFHEEEVGRDRLRRGFDLVRSIRIARDSCESGNGLSGCIEQERKGYQDPADYVYPGQRRCRSACKCFSQWKNSQTGEVAA